MVEDRTYDPERRKDRRLPMHARVCIAPREGSGAFRGDLVDVSAGGLRARAAPPARYPEGSEVTVEIRLGAKGEADPTADVCLRGAAVVVRVQERDGRLDTAVRFTGPLDMSEPFDRLLIY